MYQNLSSHLSTDGHLYYFYFLANVNSATENICIQIFVGAPIFRFFCRLYLSVELRGHIVMLFNLLRNYQDIFCEHLPAFHQAWFRVRHIFNTFLSVVILMHAK